MKTWHLQQNLHKNTVKEESREQLILPFYKIGLLSSSGVPTATCKNIKCYLPIFEHIVKND